MYNQTAIYTSFVPVVVAGCTVEHPGVLSRNIVDFVGEAVI